MMVNCFRQVVHPVIAFQEHDIAGVSDVLHMDVVVGCCVKIQPILKEFNIDSKGNANS